MPLNRLRLRDELELLWYFGAGRAAFERSTMGGMLNRAELFAHSGAIEWYSYQRIVAKQLVHEYGLRVSYEVLARETNSWPYVDEGEIIYPEDEITAWPSSVPTGELPSPPNRKVMERYGEASSRLRAMFEENIAVRFDRGDGQEHVLTPAQAYEVLENHCGELGATWMQHKNAKVLKVGRIGALYHMTPSGQRLLELAAADRAKAGQPLSETSLPLQMQNEVAGTGYASVKKEVKERRNIGLLKADKQARALHGAACVLFNAASRASRRVA